METKQATLDMTSRKKLETTHEPEKHMDKETKTKKNKSKGTYEKYSDAYEKAKDMTKKEKIDFIRKNGSEQQVAFIESITGKTKYTIKKKGMWKRIDKGIRPIVHILSGTDISA